MCDGAAAAAMGWLWAAAVVNLFGGRGHVVGVGDAGVIVNGLYGLLPDYIQGPN